ncbi:hypothetical protein G6F70_000894 [Rhizopus microsporus]|nr:hypothetical protein G6F70_000894 [Rhizopus microsporus]KAG1214923.1 hypothetical protein G6F69_001503 [Rhizopus microsporus]
MRLIQLPKELIKKVAQYLSREYIAQLCLTCKLGYQIFLPILYKHIVLGHRIQIRQLEQGFRRNSYLRQVARQNTQAVTLKCRQGGNDHYWKLIFSQLPKARQLYIRDYMALSVNKIQHILSTLPQVNLLDIQYCELVQSQDEEDNNLTFDHITNLNLMWTDFTVEAIERLFRCVPNLINVNLGANHNRKPLSNDTALQIMQTSCLHIRQLSVSLQQVKETTLCQAVMTYGPQLEQLSIRCEGSKTIKTISQHATHLQRLVIRHSGCNYNDVTNILKECESLNHLEMVSWPVQEYFLPHLTNGWQVDQAILSEEDRVVVIRFGHDWDPTCMQMDEILYSIAEKVKNFAVIYLVDITEVPDFNKMYELYDPCTVMFFFRNKHIMIDLGTGNNNKINWALDDKQEMIDLIEIVYRGARKGRGLVVSLKDYSTKYKY